MSSCLPATNTKTWLLSILTATALVVSPIASTVDHTGESGLRDQALNVLKRSIGFRTVNSRKEVVAYAEYLRGVLVEAGFAPEDVIIENVATTATLRATLAGTDRSRKPLVLLGHMDVVDARREEWGTDPFTPVVKDGYVFGRGAVDNKFEISIMVTTLARLKREGWRPTRDVVLALSGDEETMMFSTRVLARQLSNAELVLNSDDGGGTLAETGAPVYYAIQTGEKTYADFRITFTDAGGHSSRPTKSNAIYRLAAALQRLDAHTFPAQQSALTKAYFEARAAITVGRIGDAMREFAADPGNEAAIAALAADPDYAGLLRTTCVATMIIGGHAPNALPQTATATVNCRIFPGDSSESVRDTLERVVSDPSAKIERMKDGAVDSAESPVRQDVMSAVSKAVHARFPQVPIIPTMSAAATDSVHFRALGVPTYGVPGLFMKSSDDFVHGLNERVPISAIDGSLSHWNSLLRTLAE